ncbi:MAG: ImmA/IrrE family metallo-endopeptidase [Planctomycetes bacterium]|nr:ImmA/IrrE family metallo-endopeptidase [Planctomycetota bacterium]
MLQFDPIDPKVLGQRLTEARKARNITQEEAAGHLHCSRPTLIAIEKGTRPAKADEIVALASFYGRQVHELVRPGTPISDLQPHLRAVVSQGRADDPELLSAIAGLQKFAADYHRLEEILGVPLQLNYPAEVRLGSHVSVVALAEDVATQERQRLGLGDQPIEELRDLLEMEVGLRIVYESLPSKIAGMFAFSSEFGGVIAVNMKHPAQRRRATMLHEYGHLITDRYKPGVDYINYPGSRKPPNERFAESFSMAFLMPATSVRRRFNHIVNSSGDFQIADLCRLKHCYFVSLEAMTLRLERLNLIPKGVLQHLKESRFEVRKAEEMLGLREDRGAGGRFSQRYVSLAVDAYERGELSEGQLASFLRCDRVTAREIRQQYLTTTDLSDEGEVLQVQLESQHSLLTDRK